MTTELSYDVFLSYRHRDPDQRWVRERLDQGLRASGIQVCVDYRCFRLGAPLVLEMGRAVEKSRYTLAVLTPAYLESDFGEFENVLAEHLGLEESSRRLLLVLREPCRPRLSLRSRLWLDMTDDSAFEANLTRLVDQLQRDPGE